MPCGKSLLSIAAIEHITTSANIVSIVVCIRFVFALCDRNPIINIVSAIMNPNTALSINSDMNHASVGNSLYVLFSFSFFIFSLSANIGCVSCAIIICASSMVAAMSDTDATNTGNTLSTAA